LRAWCIDHMTAVRAAATERGWEVLSVESGSFMNACRAAYWGGGAEPTTSPAGEVTYSVTGSASRASVTFQNNMGETERHTVSIPWSVTYPGFEPGDFLSISAKSVGQSGTLRCEVKFGSRVALSDDASGPYAACDALGTYHT
jgi:hypothetical protein